MNKILDILANNARASFEDIGRQTGFKASEVKKAIEGWEKDSTILGYKAVLHPDHLKGSGVVALIEVSITPQKDVGFDHVAERIYQFSEVKTCYLVSGGYDLLVVVEGENIQTVANFVASKLSPMENVRQTTTHFLLKKYKEDGQIFNKTNKPKRLNISY